MIDLSAACKTLLPAPREIHVSPGVAILSRDSALNLSVDDVRVSAACRKWIGTLPFHGTSARVTITTQNRATPHAQGYRLEIRADEVNLIGNSPAGCFHGLQTLQQLAQGDNTIPCVTVVDWPDFTTRGLLHDVTRGKVPTLTTLKHLVDRLTLLKANQLQLYIEHAFVFGFDPEICPADEGLTPDEVRALDAYCRERFIDLVPALATFGHMGRILSMPKYRHLAEIEPTQLWSELPWPQRARGFTLDCMNPEGQALVERLWGEILAAFSAPVVNICGDEPWDLGMGKNRARFREGEKGKAYVDHIRRTMVFCQSHGRKVQFWSDVIRNHPHLLDATFKEATVLHWGYDDRADYDGTALFTSKGIDTVVCPGTTGWKRILNAMNLAERNIAAFAAAGRRHGASGLINTDWGDHGHFNALACSWHAIALGSCLGWNADHATGRNFDEAFARHFLKSEDCRWVTELRAASAPADSWETWRLFWQPLHSVGAEESLPTPEILKSASVHAGTAARRLKEATADNCDALEWQVACLFTDLLALKIEFAHAMRNGSVNKAFVQKGEAWVVGVTRAKSAYAEAFSRRYKAAGLRDIERALDTARDEIRTYSSANL